MFIKTGDNGVFLQTTIAAFLSPLFTYRSIIIYEAVKLYHPLICHLTYKTIAQREKQETEGWYGPASGFKKSWLGQKRGISIDSACGRSSVKGWSCVTVMEITHPHCPHITSTCMPAATKTEQHGYKEVFGKEWQVLKRCLIATCTEIIIWGLHNTVGRCLGTLLKSCIGLCWK